MSDTQPRKPAGTPAGGEFAGKTGSAPSTALTPSLPDGWNARDVEDCFNSYTECAAWSSTVTNAEGDEVPADSLDVEFSAAARQTLRKELEDFLGDSASLLEQAAVQHGYTREQAGHDFWLTRNGHGAGFWDRGLGPVGEDLSKAAKAYGSVELYLGDSGELEVG